MQAAPSAACSLDGRRKARLLAALGCWLRGAALRAAQRVHTACHWSCQAAEAGLRAARLQPRHPRRGQRGRACGTCAACAERQAVLQVAAFVHPPSALGVLAGIQAALQQAGQQAPARLAALAPEQRDSLRAVLLQARCAPPAWPLLQILCDCMRCTGRVTARDNIRSARQQCCGSALMLLRISQPWQAA